MGSIFSGSSSSTTKTSQNQTQTSNPLIPSYIGTGEEGYYGALNGMESVVNPSNAAAYFVPGATNDQTTAYNGAGALGSTTNPTYTSAINDLLNSTSKGVNLSGATTVGTTPQIAASSLLTNNGGVNSYLSPYLGDVLATTIGTENLQNGEQNAALENQGALSDAFGSSRFGIAQGNLLAQQGLNDATTNSGLLNTGFNTALGADESDTALAQQAAIANQGATLSNQQLQANLNQNNNQFNASSANTYDSNLINAGQALTQNATDQSAAQNQAVNTQLAAGQDQRSVEAQQQDAYLQYLSELQSLLGVNASSLFGQTATGQASGTSTTDSTTTPSLFSDLTSLINGSSSTAANGTKSSGIASLFAG